MSQQKKRHAAKRPLEKTLLDEVQETITRWNVLSVEEEYAGYWDSLGFRIDVSEETTAEDVLEMGNALLALMKSSCGRGADGHLDHRNLSERPAGAGRHTEGQAPIHLCGVWI